MPLSRQHISARWIARQRTGGGDQLSELAAALELDWTARVVAESRSHEREDEGVAIMSWVPLLATTGSPLRLTALHAAVCAEDGRDAQIATLAELTQDRVLFGADLNAPPALVRPVLGGIFADTLGWREDPTWPVGADEFVRAWEEKLGQKPPGDPEPRRIDYLLWRGLKVASLGSFALGDGARSASDHCLVWADLSPWTADEPRASIDSAPPAMSCCLDRGHNECEETRPS